MAPQWSTACQSELAKVKALHAEHSQRAVGPDCRNMLLHHRQPLPASVACRQQNDNRLYLVRTFQRPSRIPAGQHPLGGRQHSPGATRAAGGHLQGIPLIGRRHVVLGAVATESLTGRVILQDSYDEGVFDPSNDLRELAAAQLHSLFQVLKRISPGSQSSCKACVYARRADSLDAPQMKLQRVACCKSAQLQTHSFGGSSSSNPSSINSFEELDEILSLHRAAWEPGSSGSGSSSGCETEALLINEEIVLLPSSNLLVLPLAEAGVLVGLLVVEVVSKPGSPAPYQPQPIAQDPQQQQAGQTVWELPPVLGLSEDVLWALRMSVPPLAKACAMDLRTALAGAQQEARQRLARSLLLEARGPLKVLGTFGQMLSPRLRTGQTGEPESDMADGMLLQGQRLADVVAQLEAALRPPPRPVGTPVGLSADGSSSSSWDSEQQPWREPLALPPATADDGNVSDEDDSWAFAEATPQQQQAAGNRTRSGSTSSRPVALPSGMVPAQRLPQSSNSGPHKLIGPGSHLVQQQPAVVDLVPGQHTAESLGSSSRDIRWGAVQPPPATARRVLPTSSPSRSSTGATATTSRSGGSSSSTLYVPSMAAFDAAKTIDLEVQPLEGAATAAAGASGPAGSSTGSSSSLGSDVQAASGGVATGGSAKQGPDARPHVCNVADVLSHLLSAAANLAKAQGINLIVNHPLTLDPPLASTTSSSSSDGDARSSPTTAAGGNVGSSSSSSSSTALALLPRPVRPLLVGVAGNVCHRVLGYCVDVALQITPRGGQLCVTARASSGGVEVSLMHTGRAQTNRLHTSTASIDAAALGAAAPALAAGAADAAAAGAVGSLVRRRKRKRNSGSSTSSASSVSSRSRVGSSSSGSKWSAGLQELSSSSGLRGGSSLITLDFARQVLQSIGGRLSLTYPCHFINAMTGQLEVGSNIEVWLPPPAATTG